MPAGDWVDDIAVQTTKELTTTGGKRTASSTVVANTTVLPSVGSPPNVPLLVRMQAQYGMQLADVQLSLSLKQPASA
jgi:hypothetical protein